MDCRSCYRRRARPGGRSLFYRLFFLDGANRIERAHEFEAEDDEAAIRISEAWREGRRMELWQRDRKIRIWDQNDLSWASPGP
jgi:hypothetical protein